MKKILIPYARTHMELNLPKERLAGILESKAHHYQPTAGEADLVLQALAEPIGSPRLRDLVKDKRKIVIVTSDHTRPLPTKITAPILLAEIRAGNPDAEITI